MKDSKTNTEIEVLITTAVEDELSIHQLLTTVEQLPRYNENAKENIISELELANQAHHLLQASPLMTSTDDLEKRILRRIKKNRRNTKYTQPSSDYSSTLYVVMVMILMVLSIFHIYVHQQSKAHYQTPLRPLTHIQISTPPKSPPNKSH